MPGKTKLSSYCIVRDDERLHLFIVSRMGQRKMSIHDAAEYLGVNHSNVRKYIKNMEHSISQQKVIALAAHLDIGLELNITAQ